MTEAVPPAPFSLGDISCNDNDSTGDNDARTATFNLDPGEDITCTFVNVLPGTITITKVADPEDGTDFDFTTAGAGLSDFTLDDDTDGTLPNNESFLSLSPGSDYRVDETPVTGWDLASIDCNVTGVGTSATPDGTG